MLIDSIMGTIDHIYCDNTFHVITEQNHRRNTIVRHPVGDAPTNSKFLDISQLDPYFHQVNSFFTFFVISTKKLPSIFFST